MSYDVSTDTAEQRCVLASGPSRVVQLACCIHYSIRQIASKSASPVQKPMSRSPAWQVPNFLGGGGVIRDDSITPEVCTNAGSCHTLLAQPCTSACFLHFGLALQNFQVPHAARPVHNSPNATSLRWVNDVFRSLLRSKPQRTTLPPPRLARAALLTQRRRLWASSRLL